MRVDPEAAHARLAHRAFLGIDVVLAHQEGAAGEPDRRVGDPRALALAVRRRHLRAVVGVAPRRAASEDDERGKKRHQRARGHEGTPPRPEKRASGEWWVENVSSGRVADTK